MSGREKRMIIGGKVIIIVINNNSAIPWGMSSNANKSWGFIRAFTLMFDCYYLSKWKFSHTTIFIPICLGNRKGATFRYSFTRSCEDYCGSARGPNRQPEFNEWWVSKQPTKNRTDNEWLRQSCLLVPLSDGNSDWSVEGGFWLAQTSAYTHEFGHVTCGSMWANRAAD